MKLVRFGRQTAEEKPASGVNGLLCKSIINGRTEFIFRVTSSNGEIQDYELRHDDLCITIAQNDLASFYQLDNGVKILDHSSEVLGLTKIENFNNV